MPRLLSAVAPAAAAGAAAAAGRGPLHAAIFLAALVAITARGEAAAGAAALSSSSRARPTLATRVLRDSDVKFPATLLEYKDFYSSTDQILSEMRAFKGNCPGANFEMTPKTAEHGGKSITLEVIHVRGSDDAQQGAAARQKALFVFGEHAREFISMESALHFVKALCSNDDRAKEALQHFDVTLVPVANPEMRKFAENGHFCKRRNENNVDLNRNFGAFRLPVGEAKQESNETYGGPDPKGFSEPASRIIADLAQKEKPISYVSVHSGGYLVAMPFGYQKNTRPEPDVANLEDVLTKIRKQACKDECRMGTLAEAINYDNPGCDMDWMYEKAKVPYSFTWEVYSGEHYGLWAATAASSLAQDAVSPSSASASAADGAAKEAGVSGVAQVQVQEAQADSHARTHDGSVRQRVRRALAASQAQRGSQEALQRDRPQQQEQPNRRTEIDENSLTWTQSEALSCFKLFNPIDKETFHNTLNSWTDAYLELFKIIREQKQKTQV